ncbi:MAG: hypothetical protein ACE5KY_06775, partial [Candidatus Tectimicrobiota bacterium]
ILMRSYSTPNGSFLSRAIGTIEVSEVLETVRQRKQREEHSLVPYTDAKVQELFHRMDEAYDEAVASLTLADLLPEGRAPQVPPAVAADASRPAGGAS